jgi:hypothetical protein
MDPLRQCRNIKLQKGGNSLLFNIVVNTPKGALYVGTFCRKGADEVIRGAVDKAPTYSINKAHALQGHNNENNIWTITSGSLGMCESCANAKAR